MGEPVRFAEWPELMRLDKSVWKIAAACVAAAVAAVYASDYAIVLSRRNSIATVEVAQYYAIPLKNGQTQFSFAGNKSVACVESLFPHFDERPCWYLRRHTEEWIRP
jgi:hypothetical protein